MAFISTVSKEQAPADVAQMYEDNIKSKGYLPNYVRIFSHRPQVLAAWGQLLHSIKSDMDPRRYELVTLAAARALKSSYCMLAHGSVLLGLLPGDEQLARIAGDYRAAGLTPAEVAMMAFAEQIVRDASAITPDDVADLRGHGFSDPEIFEIVTTATARCFFSKTLDALGAEPDSEYLGLGPELLEALTVGRPVSDQPSPSSPSRG